MSRSVDLPLRVLIQLRYRSFDAARSSADQLIGNDRFDINAKAEAPTSPDQLELMLRALLGDRFRGAAHTEMRDDSIYALVIARSDRKLGPNLHPAVADCATLRATPAARGTPNGSGQCGSLGGIPPGTMTVRGLALGQLGVLSREVGRKIVDKTGLTGSFDWDLKWTPQTQFAPGRFPSIDPDGPSLFTAMQEQLGLKLEAQQDKGEFSSSIEWSIPTED